MSTGIVSREIGRKPCFLSESIICLSKSVVLLSEFIVCFIVGIRCFTINIGGGVLVHVLLSEFVAGSPLGGELLSRSLRHPPSSGLRAMQ